MRASPLGDDEQTYLDLEIWRMADETLGSFLEGFEELLIGTGGRVTDKLIRENFCLLRIDGKHDILEKVLELREVCSIDRLPKPYIDYSYFRIALEDLSIEPICDVADKAAIAVLDSGIVSNHPLFRGAVGDEIAVTTSQIDEDKPQDDVGHGTRVAGVALYGDLKDCVDRKEFKQELIIVSAKILYAEYDLNGNPLPKFDEGELLEHQLLDIVDEITRNYPQCRVFNLSLGTQETILGRKRQFNLALLIDELSKERNVIFTISAGNIPFNDIPLENYPHYLLEESSDVKILNPASSVLALIVGSIVQRYGPFLRMEQDILHSPVQQGHPSPFTRVGMGYRDMIKPDIVEVGGNYIPEAYTSHPNLGGHVLSLNKDFAHEGRLFSVDCGTSYSSPKIAYYLGKLMNRYPGYGTFPFIQTGDVSQANKYITTYKQKLNENGIKVSKKFKKNTIVMTIAANIGDVAILGFDTYFPDSIVGFLTEENHHYFYYLLTATKSELDKVKITNTQDNLNLERLNGLLKIYPPQEEQTAIAHYLDEKTAQIDKRSSF